MNAKKAKKLRRFIRACLRPTEASYIAQKTNPTTSLLDPRTEKGLYKLAKKIGALDAMYVLDQILTAEKNGTSQLPKPKVL